MGSDDVAAQAQAKADSTASDVKAYPDVRSDASAEKQNKAIEEAFLPDTKPFFVAESPMSQVIPAAAGAVVVARNIGELAGKMGLHRLMQLRPEWVHKVSQAVVAGGGRGVMRFEDLDLLGLATASEAAMWYVPGGPRYTALLVQLKDAVVFTDLVGRGLKGAGFEVIERPSGQWRVTIAPKYGWALLVNQPYAILVWGVGSAADLESAVTQVITTNPGNSVASRSDVWTALGNVQAGTDMSGYADLTALSESVYQGWKYTLDTETTAARDGIRQAREKAQTPEEIASLDARELALNEWYGRRLTGDQGLVRLMDLVLGKPAIAAFGIDVVKQAVKFKAFVSIPQTSFVRKMFVNSSGTPASLRTLKSRPAQIFYANTDPVAWYQFFESLASLDGTTLGAIVVETSKALGLPVDGIMAQWSGEVFSSFWGAPDFSIANVDNVLAPLRGGAIFGVKDGPGVMNILGSRLSQTDLLSYVTRDSAGYSLSIAGHPLYLRQRDNYIVISTDSELDPTKVPETLQLSEETSSSPDLVGLLGTQDPAMVYFADFSAPISLAVLANVRLTWPDLDKPFWNEPLSPTPEYLAAKDAYLATVDEIRRHQIETQQQLFLLVSRAVEQAGYFGLVLRVTDGGLVALGGQLVTAPDIGEWFAGGINQIARAVEVTSQAELVRNALRQKLAVQAETLFSLFEPPPLPAGSMPASFSVPKENSEPAGDQSQVTKPDGSGSSSTAADKGTAQEEPPLPKVPPSTMPANVPQK